MSQRPKTRVVLTGASNVTLHLHSLLRAVRDRLQGPLEFLIAAGHGRAYAVESCFLARGLPAICDCGLWPALAAREPLPTYALLTDVGNDLAYGVPTAQLEAAIGACAERLCAGGARVVATLFPEASVERLGSWRFYLFRSLLFPGRRFSPSAILAAGHEVDRLLRERLGSTLACAIVAPAPEWYGTDRIHLRRRERAAAWRTVLSGWPPTEEGPPQALGKSGQRRLPPRRLAPERWTLFGVERTRPQPSATLADGTTLSMF